MPADEWLQALLIAVTSVGSAAIALLISSLLSTRPFRFRPAAPLRPEREETIFLFDDRKLIDATAPARRLIDAQPLAGSDWARFLAFAAPRFGNLSAIMGTLARQHRIELTANREETQSAPLRLVAEDIAGLARITLHDPQAEGHGLLVDGLSLRALEDEIELLRDFCDGLPALAWRQGAEGTIDWANRTYLTLCGAFDGDGIGLSWPLPKLFPDWPEGPGPHRLSLRTGEDTQLWFDGYTAETGTGSLRFALPADAAVRAERSQRDFVQTLSKTFADLPIGLAVFDRKRQLQIFNPALIELTHLESAFLLARPTLYAFLDRLREDRIIPEPRDYPSWRAHMTELEKAAASGFHSETWNLSGGQTYRVTGRPHPGGAVAFLIEDITSETAGTRRFRAEIELGQEVLDRVSDAVAVFAAGGEMILSNAAYAALWGAPSQTTLARMGFRDALAIWERTSGTRQPWAKLRTSGTEAEALRTPPVAENFRLRDGREMRVHLLPISGGSVMVRFLPLVPAPPRRKGNLAPTDG